VVRYKSLQEKLEEIIEKYENRIIDSAKVIESLIDVAKEIKGAEQAGEDLGLSEEELAFYDALSKGKRGIKSDEKTKELVKRIVKSIRRDLAVDWTNREQVKARIRSRVRILLVQNGFTMKETEPVVDNVYQQAFALFKDYVPTKVGVGK